MKKIVIEVLIMKKSFFISFIISFVLFLILSPVFLQLVTFLHPIFIFVVFFCLFILVSFLVLFIRKESIDLPYSKFRFLLLFYSIALLILLFFRPVDPNYQSINLIPFSTISFYFSGKVNGLISFYNLAANISLFIPFGIFLLVKRLSRFKRLYIPILSISIIELLQYLTRRGTFDIDDFLLNVLGFFIGYLLYPLFSKIIKVSA